MLDKTLKIFTPFMIGYLVGYWERTYAWSKGEEITSVEAQQFVSQQAAGQVFRGRLPSDGKKSASREDMRCQADLLDFSKRPSSQRGRASKYALVVTDVFTKEAWVEKMRDKADAEAKNATRKIIASNVGVAPKEVSLEKSWGPALSSIWRIKGQ